MTDGELFRFKPEVMNHLHQHCAEYLDEYRNPNADFDKILRDAGYPEYKEPVDVKLVGSLELHIPDEKTPRYAELDATKFYQALEGMSPRYATDPSLLAYINHFYMHHYGITRWGISDDDEKAVTDIRNHWITYDGSFVSLYERNIAGRTWWIAHTSIMAAKASDGAFTTEQVLEKFVSTAEYYHRTMEWEILYNYDIMSECVFTLLNDQQKISINQYREMIGSVNREAGSKILDGIDRYRLREIVTRAARDAYESKID